MVLLGEVDELEVGREGADDRLGLPLREVGEHLPQALLAKLALPRRSASPQDGELADLLLEEEEALTGLGAQHLAENLPQQAHVPAEGEIHLPLARHGL